MLLDVLSRLAIGGNPPLSRANAYRRAFYR